MKLYGCNLRVVCALSIKHGVLHFTKGLMTACISRMDLTRRSLEYWISTYRIPVLCCQQKFPQTQTCEYLWRCLCHEQLVHLSHSFLLHQDSCLPYLGISKFGLALYNNLIYFVLVPYFWVRSCFVRNLFPLPKLSFLLALWDSWNTLDCCRSRQVHALWHRKHDRYDWVPTESDRLLLFVQCIRRL